MSRYLAHISPAGPIRFGQVHGAIGVLEDPGKPMPSGMALVVGWTEDRLAVWQLTVRGAEILGRWVIVDREFRPAPT
jgi:hypothetical protein